MAKMTRINQAVILAGGRGTRLLPLTQHTPKPMVILNQKPFLEYLLELLKENGIREIVLLLGYLPEKIVDYFGDGSAWGVKIKYSLGAVEEETGTRLRGAAALLEQRFLLMYCDNYWPLDLNSLAEFYERQKTLASVTVYANRDGITKNNIFVDEKGMVKKYDKSRTDPNLNGVELGFFIMDKKILELMPEGNFSFEQEILPALIRRNALSGFLTDHRYYSVSTPEKLKLAEEFLKPRKVIFLDRDGVINRKAPEGDYVKNWGEFEFLPGAVTALKMLVRASYELYLISNQAGISRGLFTEADLGEIHKRMEMALGREGVSFAGIYFCPHGREDGCECRKPKPGLLFRAARENRLNLKNIIFIGDDERDMAAGRAAGCKTVLVGGKLSLLEAVNKLINQ